MNHEHDPPASRDEELQPQGQAKICRACGAVVLGLDRVELLAPRYELDLSLPTGQCAMSDEERWEEIRVINESAFGEDTSSVPSDVTDGFDSNGNVRYFN